MTKKDLTNPADQFMEKTENRSQHASLLLKPSTANSLKLIAQFEGTSVNDIANQLLDDYVKKFREDPENANKLNQALELFSQIKSLTNR